MMQYKSPQVELLAAQLKRGPRRLCLKHLCRIEFALSTLEPGRAVPWDFIRFTITGLRPAYQSQTAEKVVLTPSTTLRDDLVRLAEDLSAAAGYRATDVPEPLSTPNELAERFNISPKTLCRWRKRGLVAWKLLGEDGRLHAYFAERCVRRFVAENTGLVRRAASFAQVTAGEREKIVARARELAAEGRSTLHAIAQEISQEIGRARETVRQLLKQYEADHPHDPIVGAPNAAANLTGDQLRIWSAYEDGQTVDRIAETTGLPLQRIYQTVTRMRAITLQTQTIELVEAAEFADSSVRDEILNDPDADAPYAEEDKDPRVPANAPPYFQELCRLPLLSPAGERALFRKMNYLKYLADQHRQAIDPDEVTATELDEVDALLAEAQRIRDRILKANLRMVVYAAKGHLAADNDLYELISEGNVTLLRAVERFDYSRGFKFSTYALWALRRELARRTTAARRHQAQYVTGFDDNLGLEVVHEPDEPSESGSEIVRRAASILSKREWYVVSEHFGLESNGASRSLADIGRVLGVSKERVRQIEMAALATLRDALGVSAIGA